MRKLASCFLLALIACAAAAPKTKISSDLKNAGKAGTAQVIVQWNIETGDGTAQKIAALGGTVISQFHSVDCGVYVIPSTAADDLEADADVRFVSVDRQIKKKAAAIGITPATINADAVWNAGYNGNGVGVAILDSGINSDDDLGVYSHAPVYTEDFTVPKGLINGKPAPKPP